LDDALEATLESMGCLARSEPQSAKPKSQAATLAMTALIAVTGAMLQIGEARAAPGVQIDSSAPVVSRGDILIKAPLDTIWRIQTGISAWTTWRPTVNAGRLDGQLQAGSVFEWEEGGLKIVSTVQELLPLRRIVWTGPAQGINAIHVWEFTPTPEGVRVHTEESWSGDVAQANAATLRPLLDNALQEWLVRLKETSEVLAATETL
jgi:hypothetical protein